MVRTRKRRSNHPKPPDGITFLWLEGDGEDRVRNLDDLRYFANPRSLEIWNASGISSFEPLWNLETINNLYIYGARKPDFSGMSALSALQILDLSDCSLQDLDFLSSVRFTELFHLIFEANYLDLSKGSKNSDQIQSLEKRIEENRKTKIEAGLYERTMVVGSCKLGMKWKCGWIRVSRRAWNTTGKSPRQCKTWTWRFHEWTKLLENPNDPLANLLQGIHSFSASQNPPKSKD